MALRIGRNMRHLLDFMDKYPDGRRFSFAYRDRATASAIKTLERHGMIRVDWVTNQVILPRVK